MPKIWFGGAGYRSRYLSHAKRALYHLSYAPLGGNQCCVVDLNLHNHVHPALDRIEICPRRLDSLTHIAVSLNFVGITARPRANVKPDLS